MTWGVLGVLLAVDFVAGVLAYGLRSFNALHALSQDTPYIRSVVAPTLLVITLTGALVTAWALGSLLPVASLLIPRALVPLVIVLVGPFSLMIVGVCVIEVKKFRARRQ